MSLRRAFLLVPLVAACIHSEPVRNPRLDARTADQAGQTVPVDVAELTALHARHRDPSIGDRRFTHADLWGAIGGVIDEAESLSREEIGISAEGRPIYGVRYGAGPTRVLLWSQMHGDESTATMSLADLARFLAADADHPIARRLKERLSIVLVPMLNPDGAERFRRQNAYGVDINRDARALATPEARTLKSLRDEFEPHFGFNLHDQSVRTRVGRSDRIAAIALLAPAFDQSRAMNDVRARAVRVASVIHAAVEPLVPGHISRYDDTFNPRAFGDLMQTWGTSTVLIESGGWTNDPEKQHLREVNFVAILAALDAIASGAWADADPEVYLALPQNGPRAVDLLVRGGTLVIPGLDPARVDIAVDFDDPLRRTGPRVVEVGDLSAVVAIDTVDAEGRFIHPRAEVLDWSGGGAALRPGSAFEFDLRDRAEPE